jgi:histidinol-phosphate/aromatic aminotransferase/cobyric acid decarboxylase-like protein
MIPTTQVAGREKFLVLSFATAEQRKEIYRIRHKVYAEELSQYPVNDKGVLKTDLDKYNVYITAVVEGELVGFISITPPGYRYSVHRYLDHDQFADLFSESLHEIRLLTVIDKNRSSRIFFFLAWAAVKWIQSQGGDQIVAIGRDILIPMYQKAGFIPQDHTIKSGAINYELLRTSVDRMLEWMGRYYRIIGNYKPGITWDLPGTLAINDGTDEQCLSCFHGGRFLNNGDTLLRDPSTLNSVVTADVLDAWFDPAPAVLDFIGEHMAKIIKTSPPVNPSIVENDIARSRGIEPRSVMAGSGSSDLIFLALPRFLNSESRVLVLDPAYGEYIYILEEVIGCNVDRYYLQEEQAFAADPEVLSGFVSTGYDAVILVNPNNPTGNLLERNTLLKIIENAPEQTLFWIDETYIDYIGKEHSLESSAQSRNNVVICKSLSKVFAFSGIRAGYLVSAPALLDELRPAAPPWSLSYPASVAVIQALASEPWYRERYIETEKMREDLILRIEEMESITVIAGMANFVLCRLTDPNLTSVTVCDRAAEHGVHLRDVTNMGAAFRSRYIRIAVKSSRENDRIIEALKYAVDLPSGV